MDSRVKKKLFLETNYPHYLLKGLFSSQISGSIYFTLFCVLTLCPVEPLSSVSSLEVHFDLLDLTELTDMSDQELAEVFADSDEENHNGSRAGEVCKNLLCTICTDIKSFCCSTTFDQVF